MSLHASRPDDGSGFWRIGASVLLLAGAVVVGAMAAGAASGFDPSLSVNDRTDDGVLVVLESPSNETVHYQFNIDGAVEPAREQGGTIEPGELDNGVAEGTINGSDVDAFRVSGSITGLTLAGNATLLLDGQETTPANLSDGWAVTFANCSTVDVAGDFAAGYGFSTVVFPVRGPDGELMGFEEQAVNEPLTVENQTASLQAGTTLPEDVSEISALRSVFLYEEQVERADPLLVESEVTVLLGQPAVRVENPAHETCRETIKDRFENETVGNGSTTSGIGKMDDLS